MKELVKGMLITILIMIVCFVVVDLYVPLKRMLMGDGMSLGETLSFIKLKHHLYISSLLAVVLELYRYQKSSKGKQVV